MRESCAGTPALGHPLVGGDARDGETNKPCGLVYPERLIWDHIHLPTYFSLETTIKCPARCTMCPRPSVIRSRHNKLMPEWMVAKILDEIDWPCYINWEWINEPLCDDRIYGFMARAKAKGIRNWITTTGYLLSDERAQRLLHSGVDLVVFSIDTLDAPLYEQIRKLPLDRVMENVKAFMAYKERAGSDVDVWVSKIQLPVTRHESRDEFRSVFAEMGVSHVQFPVYRLRGGAMDREAGTAMTPDKRECYFIENEMAITTDGSVVLCPCEAGAWDQPVASIANRSLREAWFTQQRIDLISLVRSRGLRAYDLCRETTGLPE